MIGGFRSILLVSAFGCRSIMIDDSIKRNRKFGFELRSSRVFDKRYKKG